KLSGGIFTYQIFPNGFGKTFDFFFETDLMYQTGKYSFEDFQYSPQQYPYGYLVLTTVRNKKLSNFYGYGFHLNGKKVCFSDDFDAKRKLIDTEIVDLSLYNIDDKKSFEISFYLTSDNNLFKLIPRSILDALRKCYKEKKDLKFVLTPEKA